MFLGLPFGDDSNESFIKKEREADERRRRIMLAELEAQKKKDANKGDSNDSNKEEKKSRKQKFQDGFRTAEAKLDVATDKGIKAYHKAELGAEKVNLSAQRFSDAASAFSVNPSFEFAVTTPREPKRSGVNLDLFDVSAASRKGQDGLHATFGLTAPKGKKMTIQNDPLHQMFGIGSQTPKGKRKAKKEGWTWV